MLDPVILMVFTATLTIVTLASAVPKLRDLERFRSTVAGFALLPGFAVTPVARMLPLFETASAVALLSPRAHAAGASALIALFAVFTVALAINVTRGHTDIECGCSGFVTDNAGAGAAHIGWWHVGRAALLVALATGTLIPQAERAPIWIDYVSAGACTLVAVAAWFTLDLLLINLPKLDSLRNS